MSSFIAYIPPLFLCTIIFICGIIWQASNTGIASIIIAAMLIAPLFIANSFRSTCKPLIPWIILAFSLGALRNALSEYSYLHMAQELCAGKIDLQGTMIACEKTNKSYMTRITIALDNYSIEETKHYLEQPLIQLYCSAPLRVECGDTISLKNIYLKQQNKSTLTNFFKKQGIMASGFFGKSQPYLIRANPATCSSWLHKKREQLLHTFEKLLSPRTFLLVSSIFLGYKTTRTTISDKIYEQFQWWGISHYLARSGLHLVIFVLILHTLFMFIPLPFILKQIIVSSCIIAYMLFSWSSVSFMRSLVMIFCYLLSSMLKFQQHGLHTISFACVTILLYNPVFLFALDFQLSFGLTLALILLQWAKGLKLETS